MNLDQELEANGISNVNELNRIELTLVAKHIAERLTSAFPFAGFNYDSIYQKAVKTPMYKASMEFSTAGAIYYIKNSSIYFKDGLDIKDIKTLAVHEFIHKLQETRNAKGNIERMGLSDYSGIFTYGKGMNEAAVQMLAAKANKLKREHVKYFDIEFESISPNLYPLEVSLMEQITYLLGEDIVIDSTFNSNDKFKKALIKNFGYSTYYELQDSFDTILQTEDTVAYLEHVCANSTDITTKELQKNYYTISKLKEKIRANYFKSQNLIFKSYFDRQINNVFSIEEADEFRAKLGEYRDYIGSTEKYSYFNDYFMKMMMLLDKKAGEISSSTALVLYEKRPLHRIVIDSIKKIMRSFGYQEDYNTMNR